MKKEIESHRILNGYESFSQAHQDLFVRAMTKFKSNGLYVEIGAAEPKQSNNTYILERDLHWSGVSLELDSHLCALFRRARRNKCLKANATHFDYVKLFKELSFPARIDYLSLDIDPASTTLKALKTLPLSTYRFSVITFEHDCYLSGPTVMAASRGVLASHGYKLVASNVHCRGRDFEDWYVDPLAISEDTYAPFISKGKECADIFALELAAQAPQR